LFHAFGRSRLRQITGPDTLEVPSTTATTCTHTRQYLPEPNVGLLFVRFDGRRFARRIRGKTIHDSAETRAGHHGAKVVVARENRDLPKLARATFQT